MDLSYGMAPFLPEDPDNELREKAFQIGIQAGELNNSAAPATRLALSRMLSWVNAYYSNRIEGQGTHPVDVERAMREGQQANDPDTRITLALREAHDRLAVNDRLRDGDLPRTTNPDFIREIHSVIFDGLPAEERKVKDQEGLDSEPIVPGEWRKRGVKVSNHVAPDHRELEGAMSCFDKNYRLDQKRLRGEIGLIAAAASHHRLAFIHPFLDGNGRVTRLFSELYLEHVLDGPLFWSLSRGLARNRKAYYSALGAADRPRKDRYERRGPRSDAGLFEFCNFFLDQCLDQSAYMGELVSFDTYKRRVEYLVRQSSQGALPDVAKLDPAAENVLKSIYMEGELSRSAAGQLSGYKERRARDVIRQLIDEGLLESTGERGSVRPGFPARYMEYLFPKLALATS